MASPTIVTSYKPTGLKGTGSIRIAEYEGGPVRRQTYTYESIEVTMPGNRVAEAIRVALPDDSVPLVPFAKHVMHNVLAGVPLIPECRSIVRLPSGNYAFAMLGRVFGLYAFAVLVTDDLALAKELEANAPGFVAPLSTFHCEGGN